jgi:hypothetical protein
LNTNGDGIGSFTFHAHDGNSSSATVAITLNVSPVNDPPMAIDDIIALRPGEGISSFMPQANDRDVDMETLPIASFTQPDQGSVALTASGGLSFTPAASFTSGSATFQYTIRDTANVQATASVTIKLTGPTGLNWPTLGAGPDHTGFQPLLLGSAANFSESWASTLGSSVSQVAVAGGRVFVSLPARFADSSIIALDASTGGEVWRKSYTYVASMNPPSWHGGSVFTQVQDGPGQTSHLVGLNEADGSQQWASQFYQQWEHYLAPAVDDSGVYINSGSYGGISGYDRITGINRFAVGLDQYDGWTPALNSSGGLYSFVKGVFRSHDRSTGAVLWSQDFTWDWAGYTMNRTIACQPDAAFFINDTDSQSYQGPRDLICMDLASRSVRWTVRGTSFSGTPAVAHGNVYALSNGSTVSSYDTATGILNASYAAPNETGLNTQPIVTADTLIVASSTKTYLFDLLTGSLRQTLPAGGATSLAGRSLYLASSDGIVHCYGVADASNPPPIATSTTVTTDEDFAPIISLSASDASPGPLTYVITQLPAKGQLYQVGSGNARGAAITHAPANVADAQARVIYAAPADNNGTAFASFGFKASDGNSLSAQAIVTINVTPVNDAPLAAADTRQIRPGEIISPLMERANDYDVDGDSLTIVSFTQPSIGTVTLNSDGTLRYAAPADGTTGIATFSYTAADPSAASTTATISITIAEGAGGLWPTFGNGPDHTGFTPETLSRRPLTQRWSYTTPAGARQVAVAEGKVFVSTVQSSLPVIVALAEKTGALLWSKALRTSSTYASDSINSTSYYNGRLYVQHSYQNEAQLACLSSTDGTMQWSSAVGNQWYKYLAPAVSDLGVFINGGYGCGLYGYSLSGTQQFFKSTAQYDQWTPSLYQGGLYSFVEGNFTHHNLSTGVSLWSLNLGWNGYTMNGIPAFGNDSAFLINIEPQGSYTLSLNGIDLVNHSLRWKVIGSFGGTPAFANGVVFALNGNAIEARSAHDGTLIRTFNAGSSANIGYHAAPIITNDLLIARTAFNTLIFDRYDGTLLQTIPFSGEAAVVGEQLIISLADKVMAFAAAPAIAYSPAGGSFAAATSITLTAADSAATIRYTTDGSAPTLASNSVASGGSVLMEHTGRLRAIAVNGSAVSRIIEGSYTIGSGAVVAASMAFKSSAALLPSDAASADFDHDGQSDMAEAMAGTDPRRASDVFRVSACTATADGLAMHLTWPGKIGRTYRVQCSTDLQTWQDVTPSLPGTGAAMSRDVPRPAGLGPCFLRVRVE